MSAIAAALGAALLAVAEAAKKSSSSIQEEFSLDGDMWRQLYSPERKAPYFYNIRTGDTQWGDPRQGDGSEKTLFTSFILFLPFVVLIVCGGAYLLYVKIKHPEWMAAPKKARGGIRKARVCSAAQAHARGDAATRFVVDEIAQQRLYSALAGVVDLLRVAPEERLSVPHSTLRQLPDPLNQETLLVAQHMADGKGWMPGLTLFSLCIMRFVEIGARSNDLATSASDYCTAVTAAALSKSGLYLAFVRLITLLEGRMYTVADTLSTGGLNHPDYIIRAASGAAGKLGCDTFAPKCINMESGIVSPVTSNRFCGGAESCNLGPVISGVPPSPALKALTDGDELGAARKPGRTSIASLLLVLTEVSDHERSKLQPPDTDLAWKCNEAPMNSVVAQYALWLLLPEQLPTPSEPSVQASLTGCVPWRPPGYDNNERRASASLALLMELLKPAAPERLPEGVYDLKETLEQLLALGLITCMESGIRCSVAMPPTPPVHVIPKYVVHDIKGCVTLLSMCLEHGVPTTGGAAMLSLAVTLRKLLSAMQTLVGLVPEMDGTKRSAHPPECLQLEPEARVLFRHLTDNPRVMQSCVRRSHSDSPDRPSELRIAQRLGRWLAEPRGPTTAGPTAAGADYSLLQLPSGSALRVAAGCSHPRCLNAAGDSELRLKSMKRCKCGLRYCGRAYQVVVHKHVCDGKAAEWMAEASRLKLWSQDGRVGRGACVPDFCLLE
ncbi:hypothetical protein FOA52_001106 [Chlamydomonas sp. UWO 241]|nr:hypothetical protein FOA52_001106 [Chlamydomonas sp. UWO 241]